VILMGSCLNKSSNHYTPAMCNHNLRRSRHPLYQWPNDAAWKIVSEIFSIWGLCRCKFLLLPQGLLKAYGMKNTGPEITTLSFL
jgi:hypothetical protein